MHYLAFHDLKLRAGKTFSDHEKPTDVRDLRGTLTFLPARSRVWGWWLPSSREGSITTLYLNPRNMEEELAGRFRSASLRPRLYFSSPDLRSTLGKLHAALSAPDPQDALYLECLCLLSAIEVCRLHEPAREEKPAGQLAPARKAAIVDYIEAHLDGDIGLSQLAGFAGLSRHHFVRAFKSTTGETPYQFVLQRRIERAKTLLAERDMSVEEVCHAVGFHSAPAFIRSFRRLVGATPGQFRALSSRGRPD